jgi:aryl-alcohol dehydrogenase-like predicted oxidoreductase
LSTNSPVQKRSLGNTGIQVTPIGLGVMELSGGGGLMGWMFPVIPQGEKDAIIKAALEGGINWFDTAELYGKGVSERSLAAALEAEEIKDEEVIIATKWFPLLRTAGNIPHSIQERQHYLDGYTIDLYMVHQPWSFSSPEAEMDAMADLLEAGKIRSVGVSNFSATRMQRAYDQLQKHGLPLAVNQVEYSLLNREIETNGILDKAKELDVTIIAYTPLASGLLTGKYHKNPELLQKKSFFYRWRIQREIERSRPLVKELEEIAAQYNVTPAQVALNWLIHFQGETVVTIPGATKAHQAADNAAAMAFRLSGDQMARLDELTREFR